ncbi:MAG TPA: hypothetical protein VF622_10680 [Segetibacter sp.]|jgi:hypothetical protein
MHFDRDAYEVGETIWFKAYLFNNNMPSGLSNNFYLQLIDEAGKIVAHNIYPVAGASVSGNVNVPDTLAPGNYVIRAFTPRIKNVQEQFKYYKKVAIYDKGKAILHPKTELPVHLRFFPESGNLVDGISSIVAFKATDKNGYPVDVNGEIKTTTGISVVPFKSFHDGIGRLQFRPRAGVSYAAYVVINGKDFVFPLPASRQSGIVMKVEDEKNGKRFQIERNEINKAEFNDIEVVVKQNNNVVYQNNIQFNNDASVIGHLLTSNLPSGILHFTVFDNKRKPLAERLSYVNNNEYLSMVDVKVSPLNTAIGDSKSFQLSFADNVPKSISVSVTDADATFSPDKENIISRFLLTGDLKEYVYNPEYYFRANSDSAKIAIENLLITQTLERYKWNDVLTEQPTASILRDPYLLSFSGIVVNESDKKPASGGKLTIFLEAEDSTSQKFDLPVDTQGRFFTDSLLYRGSANMYYLYSAKGKAQKVVIIPELRSQDSVTPALPVSWKEVPNAIPNKTIQYYNTAQKALSDTTEIFSKKPARLDDVSVNVQAKRPKELIEELYTRGAFKSHGRFVYDSRMVPANKESLRLVDYILQTVLTIKIANGKFVNTKNFSLQNGQYWPVAIFLNESLVNISTIEQLRISDVGFIKFFETGFLGGGHDAPGGAIAIYTSKESDEKPKPVAVAAKNLPYIIQTGYALTQDFNSSQSNIKSVKKQTGTTTLYWNPYLPVQNGVPISQVVFYNNGSAKKIRVVVEGFDANGKLIYLEKVLTAD